MNSNDERCECGERMADHYRPVSEEWIPCAMLRVRRKTTDSMNCETCESTLNPVEAAMATDGHLICMGCVRARAKVATSGRGRCTCPKRLKRPTDIKRIGSRAWIACERCLGQIAQVS
jgi:hypothetical protein